MQISCPCLWTTSSRKVWTFTAFLSTEVPFSSPDFNNFLFLSSPLTQENSVKSCPHLPILGKFCDGSSESLEHRGQREPSHIPGQMVKERRKKVAMYKPKPQDMGHLPASNEKLSKSRGRPCLCPVFPLTRDFQLLSTCL